MSDIEITTAEDLIIFLFSTLYTPTSVTEDEVSFNKESILIAMNAIDQFMSQVYNSNFLEDVVKGD